MNKYNADDDVLLYLRDRHTGAENAVPSERIEFMFSLNGRVVRQIINKLRCDGQPICSDANGYYYAKNCDEINNTVTQLLNRTKKISEAVQGLVISHQVFCDGTEGKAYDNR